MSTSGVSSARSNAIDSIIETIAERLAEPARTFPQGKEAPSRSLLDRECGQVLLYAELGHVDPSYRQIAHRYLAVANQSLVNESHHALYDGIPALAFSASSAVRNDGDYAELLTGLDVSVFRVVRVVLGKEHDRLSSGAAAEHYMNFDLISGLTGLGRYLLRRSPVVAEAESLLREVCDYFAILVRPVEHEGTLLPGWFASDGSLNPHPKYHSGHFNLGMAHGIPGALALLATAWRAGVRVDRHAETMEIIADFLIENSDVDENGRYWPQALAREEYSNRPDRLPRSKEAWCYGTPGVVSSLQLAGLALNRSDWIGLVRETVTDMCRLPEQQWRIQDTCLCHGWAGLLHVFARVGANDPGCELGTQLEWLADQTITRFDADLPYGYRQLYGFDGGRRDAPEFLTGAAGIALALHAYRNGVPPATGWDAAMLLG